MIYCGLRLFSLVVFGAKTDKQHPTTSRVQCFDVFCYTCILFSSHPSRMDDNMVRIHIYQWIQTDLRRLEIVGEETGHEVRLSDRIQQIFL